MKILTLLAATLTAASLLPRPAGAADLNYFLGVDDLPTLTSGTYAGQTNPNFGRLTFLWGHPSATTPSSSHYHSKAIFTYSGPASSPTVINSASNYVPEGSLPPLKLTLGAGIYANKLITSAYADPSDPNYHFSDLTLGSTQSLASAPAGSPEAFLFTSSSGRWDSAFDGADLHLQLVSLTPGLHLGGLAALDVGLHAAGDELHLASGAQTRSFTFTPVLWTDANAAPGVYEARFKLVDGNNVYGDSGVVSIRTEVVPEPSSAALLIGGTGLLAFRRRRSASQPPVRA